MKKWGVFCQRAAYKRWSGEQLPSYLHGDRGILSEHSCSVSQFSVRKIFLPDVLLPSPLFMPSVL